MAKFISCGEVNKKHFYIIVCTISLVLKDIFSGYNYNYAFKEVIKNESESRENYSKYHLINYIFCYLGTVLLSIVFHIIEKIMMKKKERQSYSQNEPRNEVKTHAKIKYIHGNKEEYISNKTIYFFFFIIFLWILEEHLIEIYTFLKNLDFWMFELVIVSHMNAKMFHLQIFRHQKLSIYYLNIIPILSKIGTIIYSFLDENNYKNNSTYAYGNDENAKKLKSLFVAHWWLAPVGFIVYILLISLRAYVISNLKWFMDIKYVPSTKLLMHYGIIGFILCSIGCLIATHWECEETYDHKKNIYDYFCIVNQNNTDIGKIRKYFDNFYIYKRYISKNILIEISKKVLTMICFFFYNYCTIIIIKYFTPVHVILSFPVYYIILKIVLIVNTFIKEKTFFTKDYNFKFRTEIFILDFIGDIGAFIGFLIYLEFIELNFCKLNYYLRKNIIKRSEHESKNNRYIINSESDNSISSLINNDSVESE